METVDILYAVAELRSDYCPRLEFKVTLGKQVTCITVLHLTDAVFHVRYQGIWCYTKKVDSKKRKMV